ncbi:DUF3332 domain-containing protein [Sinomicrobium weinanense]|uniref:DUF3332 domain-containing protein n=1 Tax=Sinomicrobium weinanense TaxID=2842200 RepID=A0A926Q2Z0_9FLAO|nr:DUF3332 domain-containing protein [Sinomicrobium weinanense]MBC9795190.1 DUF3332 domain-containing protein [Sinomicrobium weinanense]MBU3121967.1 DUF3332 domain-containing protein [Sinomicrobium weinanense]
MKKLLLCSVLSLSLLCSSCLGSFSAFNNLKDWNHTISDSKFVNNLVFWGLNIIPVYGLFFLGDALIFNVIEFWSGSNPIAMNEGEVETQTVEKDGNTIEMTATKNRMFVNVVEGPKKGEKLELFYKPSEKSWNAIRPSGEIIKLSSFEEGFYYVYMPNGKKIKIDANATRNEGLAVINKAVSAYNGEGMLAEIE